MRLRAPWRERSARGIRVVEIASLAPAPFGCMILADLGADVIRVERAADGGGGLMAPSGVLDRGRRSIAVNLKTRRRQEAVLEHSSKPPTCSSRASVPASPSAWASALTTCSPATRG